MSDARMLVAQARAWSSERTDTRVQPGWLIARLADELWPLLDRTTTTKHVAEWMIAQGYATGHGDTVEDMLGELEWQAHERGAKDGCGPLPWLARAQALEIENADLRLKLAGATDEKHHRFGSPPRPVSHPSEDWCDEYAAWYNQDA